MHFRKVGAPFLLAVVLAAASAAPAIAAATVNVTLRDKGGTMDMSKSMGMGMGMHGDMKKAMMFVDADKKKVPAGTVTFRVKNASKETIHEMLIAPARDEKTVLPFVAGENRVDEEASGHLGEVSELDPGKSGALTLDLKPGVYVLFCNIPGHYMAGMWTTIKVE